MGFNLSVLHVQMCVIGGSNHSMLNFSIMRFKSLCCAIYRMAGKVVKFSVWQGKFGTWIDSATR